MMRFGTHVRCPYCHRMHHYYIDIDIKHGATEATETVRCKAHSCGQRFDVNAFLVAQATTKELEQDNSTNL